TLPVLLLLTPDPPAPVPGSAELLVRSLAKSYRHVWVLSRPTPEQLKEELPARITEALGQPMSEDERKAQAALAMVWLKRLATGEVPGYDIRPAEAAILKALHHDELAHLAIEAAGRLPARVAQPHLADLVLDGNRRPELRLAAAEELIRAIQEQGLVLPKQQLAGLEALAAQSDAPLKGTLARVLGTFRPSAERTGKRLLRYSPAPPAAPMPPAER
ncbi:MAG: hypothetical protein RMJ52_05960, partial [Gemmataceae bacterium]|nr:hypothetical protein [Gemmataceae bacterium]